MKKKKKKKKKKTKYINPHARRWINVPKRVLYSILQIRLRICFLFLIMFLIFHSQSM